LGYLNTLACDIHHQQNRVLALFYSCIAQSRPSKLKSFTAAMPESKTTHAWHNLPWEHRISAFSALKNSFYKRHRMKKITLTKSTMRHEDGCQQLQIISVLYSDLFFSFSSSLQHSSVAGMLSMNHTTNGMSKTQPHISACALSASDVMTSPNNTERFWKTLFDQPAGLGQHQREKSWLAEMVMKTSGLSLSTK